MLSIGLDNINSLNQLAPQIQEEHYGLRQLQNFWSQETFTAALRQAHGHSFPGSICSPADREENSAFQVTPSSELDLWDFANSSPAALCMPGQQGLSQGRLDFPPALHRPDRPNSRQMLTANSSQSTVRFFFLD
jgi:hypothetical protein